MWDYEDRLYARGRYAPRPPYRRKCSAMRHARELLLFAGCVGHCAICGGLQSEVTAQLLTGLVPLNNTV